MGRTPTLRSHTLPTSRAVIALTRGSIGFPVRTTVTAPRTAHGRPTRQARAYRWRPGLRTKTTRTTPVPLSGTSPRPSGSGSGESAEGLGIVRHEDYVIDTDGAVLAQGRLHGGDRTDSGDRVEHLRGRCRDDRPDMGT